MWVCDRRNSSRSWAFVATSHNILLDPKQGPHLEVCRLIYWLYLKQSNSPRYLFRWQWEEFSKWLGSKIKKWTEKLEIVWLVWPSMNWLCLQRHFEQSSSTVQERDTPFIDDSTSIFNWICEEFQYFIEELHTESVKTPKNSLYGLNPSSIQKPGVGVYTHQNWTYPWGFFHVFLFCNCTNRANTKVSSFFCMALATQPVALWVSCPTCCSCPPCATCYPLHHPLEVGQRWIGEDQFVRDSRYWMQHNIQYIRYIYI